MSQVSDALAKMKKARDAEQTEVNRQKAENAVAEKDGKKPLPHKTKDIAREEHRIRGKNEIFDSSTSASVTSAPTLAAMKAAITAIINDEQRKLDDANTANNNARNLGQTPPYSADAIQGMEDEISGKKEMAQIVEDAQFGK